MSLFLAFTLSNEDKQKLKIPADYFKSHSSSKEYEDISAFHITLRQMLEDDNEHGKIIDLMNKWQDLFSKQKPITVYANSFCRFEGNNIVDWIGLLESLPLYQIKSEFEYLAKEMNIHLMKERFEYTPHITLAFNATRYDDFNPKFNEPIPLNINNIVLWAYDHKIRNVHLASVMHIVNT